MVAAPEQLAVKTSLEEASIPSTVTGTTKSPRTAVTGSSSTQTGGVDGSTSDSMSSQNVDAVLDAQLQSNLEGFNWDPEAYSNLFTPLEYF
ncbi:hypothetical protein QFC20_006022 [Naganishia adeliensis]|uniref:Uncharacterized protein n=1 Tax=Naganishia adeliensis TaxID=92952 RepID=A0ACC2VFY1_9TREE|nr:hypothetical protein QFC20_006022 [Naganishia adeliensis]